MLDLVPTIGSMYLILTNDSNDAIVGTFANGSSVKAAYNNRLYTFSINYAASVGANDIVLTTQSAGGILGDYNSDGAVDANDVVTWRKTFNATGLPYFGADGNGDGIVNDADYQVWGANFGRTPPAPARV